MLCFKLLFTSFASPPQRSTTPCRGGGDRFIPNRSTTDREFAQHSLSRSRDDVSSNSSAGGGNGSGNGNDAGSVAALAEQLRRQKMSQVLHGADGGGGGGASGGGGEEASLGGNGRYCPVQNTVFTLEA